MNCALISEFLHRLSDNGGDNLPGTRHNQTKHTINLIYNQYNNTDTNDKNLFEGKCIYVYP